MDLDQRAAERAFRKLDKPATYTDGSGGESIECRVICEKGLDGFSKERVRVQRIEFSFLVSEVGAHSVEAMINLNRQKFKVRQLLEDDGVVRRVQRDG